MLRELQSEFAAAILAPERLPPADVTSRNTRRPTRRFNVYRNNVVVSLVEVLEGYFPVVLRLFGREFFREMAGIFIAAHPPRSPILSRYGEELPIFLSKFEPARELTYMPDVARLEWMRRRSYHAADAKPLSAADLASIGTEAVAGLRVILHPSVHLYASVFPAVSIWHTNTHDARVRPIDVANREECALIVRPHLDVLVVPVPRAAIDFYAELQRGQPIAEASARIVSTHLAFDCRSALAILIQNGALQDYRLGSTAVIATGTLLP